MLQFPAPDAHWSDATGSQGVWMFPSLHLYSYCKGRQSWKSNGRAKRRLTSPACQQPPSSPSLPPEIIWPQRISYFFLTMTNSSWILAFSCTVFGGGNSLTTFLCLTNSYLPFKIRLKCHYSLSLRDMQMQQSPKSITNKNKVRSSICLLLADDFKWGTSLRLN